MLRTIHSVTRNQSRISYKRSPTRIQSNLTSDSQDKLMLQTHTDLLGTRNQHKPSQTRQSSSLLRIEGTMSDHSRYTQYHMAHSLLVHHRAHHHKHKVHLSFRFPHNTLCTRLQSHKSDILQHNPDKRSRIRIFQHHTQAARLTSQLVG